MENGYEITVAGRMGPVLRGAFPGLRCRHVPRHTVLAGCLTPAELLDLAERLGRLGYRLVRVHRDGDCPDAAAGRETSRTDGRRG